MIKKSIFISIALLCLPLFTFSIPHAPDVIVYKGDTLVLQANPLELRADFDSIKIKLFDGIPPCIYSGCWSGYIIEWTLEKKDLYLTNILSCCYSKDSIKANLSDIFGKEHKKGKVKADWVNGNFSVLGGKYLATVDDQIIYEKESVLTLKNGKLRKVEEYNNNSVYQSSYTEDPSKLKEYIYENINWSIIPDFGDTSISIVAIIESGDTTKPGNIQIPSMYNVRYSNYIKLDSIYKNHDVVEKELEHVVSTLPDWDMYRYRGKVLRKTSYVALTFDRYNREKYSTPK